MQTQYVTLKPKPLTREAFQPYGDVIELTGSEPITINSGNCQRYSDLASLDISVSGQTGISLFDAKAYSNPLTLTYVERHPLGSQAFLPTSADPYLVVVADDNNGQAQAPKAFITDGYQGVNYHRNTWHGVLTPIAQQDMAQQDMAQQDMAQQDMARQDIAQQSRFFVVDYIGSQNNLEEYEFKTPFLIDFGSALS